MTGVIFIGIAAGGISGAIVTRLMLEAFLKRLDKLDEEYREKMVNVVVDVINEKIKST